MCAGCLEWVSRLLAGKGKLLRQPSEFSQAAVMFLTGSPAAPRPCLPVMPHAALHTSRSASGRLSDGSTPCCSC